MWSTHAGMHRAWVGLPDWYAQARDASGATKAEILAALGDAAELAARWQRVEVGRGMHVDWPCV